MDELFYRLFKNPHLPTRNRADVGHRGDRAGRRSRKCLPNHYMARNTYLLELGVGERDKVKIELRPAKKGLTLLYPKLVAPCNED